MKPIRLSLVIILLLAFGCEDPLSCIIPREPELPNKTFPNATVDIFYSESLDAEINNEPRDNDYDYYYEVRGLPEGLEAYADFRTLTIEGTPIEAGTFRIKVYLDVDGPFRDFPQDDTPLLCSYTTSKSYLIIVE